VELAEPLGHEQLLHLRSGGVVFTVRGAPGARPPAGSPMAVRMAPERVHLFDAATGVSLRQ
jgi:multiple sugar transport system ATP-binding protein